MSDALGNYLRHSIRAEAIAARDEQVVAALVEAQIEWFNLLPFEPSKPFTDIAARLNLSEPFAARLRDRAEEKP